MAEKGNSSVSLFTKLGLRPVTKCSLAKFYVPAIGVASYTALSVNVMNPNLIIRIFPKQDVTNVLLGSALVGAGIYIYTREHLKTAETVPRIAFSATGAFFLNFGSVLAWAILRSILPPNSTLCTLAGIGTGFAIIKIGTNYLEFVDSQIVPKK